MRINYLNHFKLIPTMYVFVRNKKISQLVEKKKPLIQGYGPDFDGSDMQSDWAFKVFVNVKPHLCIKPSRTSHSE